MDIATVGAAVSGFKTAIDIVTDLSKSHTDSKITDPLNEAAKKLGDAYATLFSMQTELFQLQESKLALQDELKQHTDWQITGKDYQLEKALGGGMVYKYTKEDQPNHYLCPNCFQDKQKRILQEAASGYYQCVHCTVMFSVDLSNDDFSSAEITSSIF
jgi:hypothetical protein